MFQQRYLFGILNRLHLQSYTAQQGNHSIWSDKATALQPSGPFYSEALRHMSIDFSGAAQAQYYGCVLLNWVVEQSRNQATFRKIFIGSRWSVISPSSSEIGRLIACFLVLNIMPLYYRCNCQGAYFFKCVKHCILQK